MAIIAKTEIGCIVGALLAFCPAAKAEFLDCLYLDGFDVDESALPAVWRGNLRLHNCARRTAIPAPAPAPALPMLQWSSALAQLAQGWADQCNWRHSGAPGLGENLYGRAPWAAVHTQAALSWASEFIHYNYANNSCAAGQMCGHYTQMVWRSTARMGCATNNCNSGSPFPGFPQWTLVVCNYEPPGNWQGMRPY